MSRRIRIVLSLVVGTISAACSNTEPDSQPSVDPTPEVDEGFVEGADDDVRLFYRTVGSDGETMVVIHGFEVVAKLDGFTPARVEDVELRLGLETA